MDRNRTDGLPDAGRIVLPHRVKQALFREQRGRCRYCGLTHRIGHLEIDHKWPVSRGGGNDMSNLQLLCRACNMRKGIQTDQEFRRRYGRLMPADGGIPNPPVSQAQFAGETQRTRAAPNVRRIYHRRFSKYRRGSSYRGADSHALVVLVELLLIVIFGTLRWLADILLRGGRGRPQR